MSFGLHFFRCLGIVDNSDKPIAVPSDVKDDVAIHVIGSLEHATHFRKIVPPDRLDDAHPRFDFVCRIRIAFYRLAQMLSRNDEHQSRILHNM
jgi:hypothetical protein